MKTVSEWLNAMNAGVDWFDFYAAAEIERWHEVARNGGTRRDGDGRYHDPKLDIHRCGQWCASGCDLLLERIPPYFVGKTAERRIEALGFGIETEPLTTSKVRGVKKPTPLTTLRVRSISKGGSKACIDAANQLDRAAFEAAFEHYKDRIAEETAITEKKPFNPENSVLEELHW